MKKIQTKKVIDAIKKEMLNLYGFDISDVLIKKWAKESPFESFDTLPKP
jgi:hypothetical protein